MYGRLKQSRRTAYSNVRGLEDCTSSHCQIEAEPAMRPAALRRILPLQSDIENSPRDTEIPTGPAEATRQEGGLAASYARHNYLEFQATGLTPCQFRNEKKLASTCDSSERADEGGITYTDVGNLIGMSERQVQASMANGSIRLKDIDKLVELLHLDFDEILSEVART